MGHVQDLWVVDGKRTARYGVGSRYRPRYLAPDGREKSGPMFANGKKREAQRWIETNETAKNRGEWIDPALSRITVGEMAPLWLATKAARKHSTRYSYESIWRSRVEPEWGPCQLRALTHEDIAAWVADLIADGLSGSRVRKCHLVLSQIIKLAIKGERLGRNPADGIELPPTTARREHRYLTHEQLADLADASGRGALLVLVLGYCGLRFGEAAGLRVRDVDTMRGRLNVTRSASAMTGKIVIETPKTHCRRTVPVPRFLRDQLAVALVDRDLDDPAFPTPGGAIMRENNFRRDVFDRAVVAVGLDGLTPHDLRHTAASLAVAAGANVKLVQRMLGHASAAMTLDTYADLFDDDLDAVAKRLDKAAAASRARAARRHKDGTDDVQPLQPRQEKAG